MPVSALGGGCLLWGVSAPRGVSALGGVCSQGGICFQGCLIPGWACLLQGGSAPGGCLLWGVVCSRGVGGCLLWGVCFGGSALGGSAPGVWYPSMHRSRYPRCEHNDKQVQKYYLGHNFVAAGKYTHKCLGMNDGDLGVAALSSLFLDQSRSV